MCPLILANLAADVSEEDEVGEGDGMAELKASTERAVYMYSLVAWISHERINYLIDI